MTSTSLFVRLASIVAAAIAVLAVPLSVAASTPPATGSFPFEDNGVDPSASAACGFPVEADLSGFGKFVVRFDSEGNPTDVILHFFANGTVSGNGITLSNTYRDTLVIDLVTGSVMEVGIAFRPSAGGSPVTFDVGRLVFDPNGTVSFEAGPHESLEGDFSGLCAALGG